MSLRTAIAALACAASLAAGCGAQPRAGREALQPAADLGPAPIRQHQGRKLTDFTRLRDNSIGGPVAVDSASWRLTVDGLVARPLSWDYDRVLALPRYQKLITLPCVEGWNATGLWQGVRLRDLLDSARPAPAATTLIFHAADGEYTTSLPLAVVRERDLLLAYGINNARLDARTGFPLMLAAEDKLGYKWIKWLSRIEVSADSGYKGFWEQRGYDNTADP